MSFFSRFLKKKKASSAAPLSPLTLMQAASNVTELEVIAPQAALLVQDGVLPDGSQSVFRGWVSDALTLRQYKLKDVVLDRSLMVFLQQGRLITDTNYLQSPDALAALTIRPDDLIASPAGAEDVAACFDHWDTNYYHWLVHTLPTLFQLKRQGFNGKLILPQLTPWQQETVRLVGFDPAHSILTQPGKHYAFKTVLYTDYVRGAADFSPSALARNAYHALAAQAGVAGQEQRTLNLFIERGAASNRAMPNEVALTQALTEAGFTAVRPETMSIAEQARLFAKARIVVGALGAGMANLAWCRPGTVVFELVPQHHQNPCTLSLATQMGLPYWGELVETGVEAESHVAGSQRAFNVPAIVQRAKQLADYARDTVP
ncbi:glycosyltransferase family 61 protein [Acetobacter indonesiensis]|uniref:glycosyltransferase family 61 protein n=1 Tax=Acetobacter indonesiensis TaxID=104101 RepID=UPI000A3A562E|nr:glycosyltransferase 61 family protein [Acetobacter indonesiensis]